jgi:hypothetical protein
LIDCLLFGFKSKKQKAKSKKQKAKSNKNKRKFQEKSGV